MKKRFLSLLMVFCLMLSLAPAAFATDADDLQTRINNAEAGSTVTLSGNETISSTITINKALTLEGNGNTLTMTGGTYAIKVDTNDAVTIKNLTINATATNGRGIQLTDTKPTFTLLNSTLNVNNRGIGFSDDGTIAGAVVTIDNSTIQNSQKPAENTYENWSHQGDSRGIALWNNKGITVNIQNDSAILGFGYPINMSGDASGGVQDMQDSVINIEESNIWGWCALNIWTINTTFNITSSTLKGFVETDNSWNSFATIVLNKDIYGDLTDTDMTTNDRRNVFNISGGSIYSNVSTTADDVFHILFRVDEELLSQFNFSEDDYGEPVNLVCTQPYSAFVATYSGITTEGFTTWAANNITGAEYVTYNRGLLAPGIEVRTGEDTIAAYSIPSISADNGYEGGQTK